MTVINPKQAARRLSLLLLVPKDHWTDYELHLYNKWLYSNYDRISWLYPHITSRFDNSSIPAPS